MFSNINLEAITAKSIAINITEIKIIYEENYLLFTTTKTLTKHGVNSNNLVAS